MEQHSFQPGDKVVLKSGGPVMTVDHGTYDNGKHRCQWFVGDKLEDEIFAPTSLRLADESDDVQVF